MKLRSVNVSMGRAVVWRGQTLETGIFKEPVAGPVRVHKHHLEGDRQADLSVHGGEFMALQDVQELANFFERRVSAYQTGVTGSVGFTDEF